ncbi:MAG: lipopolysaccharide biosynthesis protein [Vicinamibacterales bacterium]
MLTSDRLLSALHANWLLNAIGLVASFCASVVLVRAVPSALFAQYSTVLAIIAVTTFVFESGANSGLTRYFHESSQHGARGTFYRRMQGRRAIGALLCSGALIAGGPWYAKATHFETLVGEPWLFTFIAAIVAATLLRLLAHYGLLALFEVRIALLLQQGFQIARALALAAVALAGGTLAQIVMTLLVVATIEAVLVHTALWRQIRAERAPLPQGFIGRAQTFGLFTILDKGCAMLGGGSVLLLVLAPHHPAATVALLGLAVDLVGKIVSVTVMPLGNLVAPYLSQTSEESGAQALAASRLTKFSSLLYCFSIGAGALLLPWFVPTVYGGEYVGAAWFALLMLLPSAFENWVRGCCSPVLLRNGRYRDVMRVNVLQAVVTLAVLSVAHRLPISAALIAVGAVRASVAALNLAAMASIVPRGTYRVPLAVFAIAAVACLAALACGRAIPLPASGRAVVQAVIFGASFYAGLRWLVFRDNDTLRLAHRIAGHRFKVFNMLLPALRVSPE